MKRISAKRKGERKGANAQVECLSIGETTQVSFRVETFDSVANGEQKDVRKLSLPFPSPFFLFSHTSFPRTTVILALIIPSVLFCDVVESIYRGFSYLRARSLVLFSRQARSARKWGDLIGRVSQTAESTRPGYGRGDLIKTERNEPGKTTGVHLSGSRTTLPKEFLLSRYLWPLL